MEPRPSQLSIVPGPTVLGIPMRTDLGIRALRNDWRAVLSARHWREDLLAGVTVGLVALPLSLAIAMASDVAPGVGLMSAVIAGLVTALFGASRVAISGPAAAMAVLVGQIVDDHGLSGLAVVALIAGTLQLLTGVLSQARWMRVVPVSVVHGFTAGVGALLLVGQLPRALGLPAPDESHVLDVAVHVGTYLHRAHPTAALVGLFSMLTTLLVPLRFPRVPAAFIAVLLPSLLVYFMGWTEDDVPLVGAATSIPTLPAFGEVPLGTLPQLAVDGLVLYAVSSLESLLSSDAVHKRRPNDPPTDHDQELIGLGLANLASTLAGGIPITGVFARSQLAADAGARTRRAALIHVGVVGFAAFGLGTVVAHVPVSALAGVLLGLAIRMLSPRYLIELWRNARMEALVFITTAVAIVGLDLVAGIQFGVVIALLVAAVRLARSSVLLTKADGTVPHTIALSGALTFLSAPQLDRIMGRVSRLSPTPGLVLDLRHVSVMDATGTDHLLGIARVYQNRGGNVVLLAAGQSVREQLLGFARGIDVEKMLATSEADIDVLFGRSRSDHARRRLKDGVKRFQSEVREQLSPLLNQLAAGQQPHTLFLTCADSRVATELITGSHPGELFMLRNIGGLMPPYGHATINDEGAALEYGVKVLGVRNIVVCGHSKCGAITALKTGKIPKDLHALSYWATSASEIAGDLRAFATVDDAAREVTVRQLENLRSYPIVREREEAGELTLSAWFYDVETVEVSEYQPTEARYVPLDQT